MRSEREMMDLLLGFAEEDPRIRLVTLEGSRTNPNIPRDAFQDYDISYFVTDMASFKESDAWLDRFGERLMMQKPEDMELFPPSLGNWFSYLMIFADGNKVDLTLIPLEETDAYFQKSDGLVEVLLDKDGRIRDKPVPTDRAYWLNRPTAREFDDCCNEFWFVSTYVVKGLARREVLFAADYLNGVVRPNLIRMMGWRVGVEHGFTFSIGKNAKFLDRYVPAEDWQLLLSTYACNGYSEMWRSLYTCHDLFRKYARAVAERLGYAYPDYDRAITGYTDKIYAEVAGAESKTQT